MHFFAFFSRTTLLNAAKIEAEKPKYEDFTIARNDDVLIGLKTSQSDGFLSTHIMALDLRTKDTHFLFELEKKQLQMKCMLLHYAIFAHLATVKRIFIQTLPHT